MIKIEKAARQTRQMMREYIRTPKGSFRNLRYWQMVARVERANGYMSLSGKEFASLMHD